MRPRTQSLLRFLADHSRSKDTVLKEVPAEWVKKQNLLELQSEITDKNQYLTRPRRPLLATFIKNYFKNHNYFDK